MDTSETPKQDVNWHAHRLIDAVNEDPRVQAWMKEQDAKVIEKDAGTDRALKDNDGNSVPNYGFGGKGACLTCSVTPASFVTIVKVSCSITGDEIDLTSENW